MGWSCSTAAHRTLIALERACLIQTGTQNGYEREHELNFWERSSFEHTDGAITGVTFNVASKSTGAFRIDADGTLSHAPRHLRDALDASMAEETTS